jgi:hypothetical protein
LGDLYYSRYLAFKISIISDAIPFPMPTTSRSSSSVASINELESLKDKMRSEDICFSEFREPDMENGELSKWWRYGVLAIVLGGFSVLSELWY